MGKKLILTIKILKDNNVDLKWEFIPRLNIKNPKYEDNMLAELMDRIMKSLKRKD